jgi:hypothetical protein
LKKSPPNIFGAPVNYPRPRWPRLAMKSSNTKLTRRAMDVELVVDVVIDIVIYARVDEELLALLRSLR